jgi:hypothetical protein
MIPNGVIQFPKRESDPSIPPEGRINFYAKEGGAFVQDENDVVDNVGFVPPLSAELGGTGLDASAIDPNHSLITGASGSFLAIPGRHWELLVNTTAPDNPTEQILSFSEPDFDQYEKVFIEAIAAVEDDSAWRQWTIRWNNLTNQYDRISHFFFFTEAGGHDTSHSANLNENFPTSFWINGVVGLSFRFVQFYMEIENGHRDDMQILVRGYQTVRATNYIGQNFVVGRDRRIDTKIQSLQFWQLTPTARWHPDSQFKIWGLR